MALFQQNEMPDLSGLNAPVVRDQILNWLLRGRGSTDRQTQIFLTGFIRMADKAHFEYQQARHALDRYIAGQGASQLFRNADHLETCLNSIKRALNFVERLASQKKGPGIPRITRRWLNANTRSVPSIRNTIEHMDDAVATGELGPGEAVALALTDDGKGAEIGKFRLTFSDLAAVVKKMNQLALALADYKEPSSPRPSE